jgi:hypothetical protein
MSPTRSGYKELGLDLVEPLQDQPRKPRRPPMGEEKKDEGARDPIKLLLEEALEKQMNAMMDNFSRILQPLPTGSASTFSSHFGGATPFKVQVNFDIPIFEGQIDGDSVDRWLNMLRGYFSVHDFSDRERIIFALLKATPHVKDWWETYWEQWSEGEPSLFLVASTWNSFRDAIKEQYYPVGSYEEKYIQWTTLRQ